MWSGLSTLYSLNSVYGFKDDMLGLDDIELMKQYKKIIEL